MQGSRSYSRRDAPRMPTREHGISRVVRRTAAADVEKRAAQAGVKLEVKQFVRGNSAVTEVEMLVTERQVSLVVIGLRVRSRVGKLLLGSVAQDTLLSVPCPVLTVKAA